MCPQLFEKVKNLAFNKIVKMIFQKKVKMNKSNQPRICCKSRHSPKLEDLPTTASPS